MTEHIMTSSMRKNTNSNSSKSSDTSTDLKNVDSRSKTAATKNSPEKSPNKRALPLSDRLQELDKINSKTLSSSPLKKLEKSPTKRVLARLQDSAPLNSKQILLTPSSSKKSVKSPRKRTLSETHLQESVPSPLKKFLLSPASLKKARNSPTKLTPLQEPVSSSSKKFSTRTPVAVKKHEKFPAKRKLSLAPSEELEQENTNLFLQSPKSLKKVGICSPEKKKPKLWKSKWQLATLTGGVTEDGKKKKSSEASRLLDDEGVINMLNRVPSVYGELPKTRTNAGSRPQRSASARQKIQPKPIVKAASKKELLEIKKARAAKAKLANINRLNTGDKTQVVTTFAKSENTTFFNRSPDVTPSKIVKIRNSSNVSPENTVQDLSSDIVKKENDGNVAKDKKDKDVIVAKDKENDVKVTKDKKDKDITVAKDKENEVDVAKDKKDKDGNGSKDKKEKETGAAKNKKKDKDINGGIVTKENHVSEESIENKDYYIYLKDLPKVELEELKTSVLRYSLPSQPKPKPVPRKPSQSKVDVKTASKTKNSNPLTATSTKTGNVKKKPTTGVDKSKLNEKPKLNENHSNSSSVIQPDTIKKSVENNPQTIVKKPNTPETILKKSPQTVTLIENRLQNLIKQFASVDTKPGEPSSLTPNHYNEIFVRFYDNFAQITLAPTRTKLKGSLNPSVIEEMIHALTYINENHRMKGVVVTGVGTVFCQGVDLCWLHRDSSERRTLVAGQLAAATERLVHCLTNYPKLLVAAVNGVAVGLGVTLLPLFDIVYANDKATFNTWYARLGQIPECAASATLPHLGAGTAGAVNEMLLMGRFLTAAEAQQVGLVTQVFFPGRLMEEVVPRMRNACSTPSLGIQWNKLLMKQTQQAQVEQVISGETELLTDMWSSKEFHTNLATFINTEKCLQFQRPTN